MTTIADKKADLAGPGVSTYEEVAKILPTDYKPLLSPKDTMKALFDVKRYIEEEMQEVCNSKVARYQTIKKIHILEREFSVEQDELTPTLKMKRKNIEKKFAEVFDRLYEDDAFGLVIVSE